MAAGGVPSLLISYSTDDGEEETMKFTTPLVRRWARGIKTGSCSQTICRKAAPVALVLARVKQEREWAAAVRTPAAAAAVDEGNFFRAA